MSQYKRDSGNRWMKRCDTCDGWTHCKRPFDTTAEPDWVCKACTRHDATIKALAERLKEFEEAAEHQRDVAMEGR